MTNVSVVIYQQVYNESAGSFWMSLWLNYEQRNSSYSALQEPQFTTCSFIDLLSGCLNHVVLPSLPTGS